MSHWRKAEHSRVLSVISGVVCLAVAGPARADENTFDGVLRRKEIAHERLCFTLPG